MKYFLHDINQQYESENILTGPGMVSTTMPANNWDLGPGVMWSPLCCSFIWSKTDKSQASSHWRWSRYRLLIFLDQTLIVTCYYENLKRQVKEIDYIFEKEILLQPTRFLLSWTSVGSVLSGTNWLGSSIFIGVPTLFPRCEDFIHWKKQSRIFSPLPK